MTELARPLETGWLPDTPIAAAASHAAYGVVNLCLAATVLWLGRRV